MSVQAYSWVLDKAPIPNPTPEGMPPASSLTLVLVALANHAGPDGRGAYPSKGTLARYCRLSERQVQRCLAALAELKLIVPGDPRLTALYARDGYRPNAWDLAISGETDSLPSPVQGRQNRHSGETESTGRGDARVSQTVLKPTTNQLISDSGESALDLGVVPEKKSPPRKVPLPNDWAVSSAHYELAQSLGFPFARVGTEVDQFRDHHTANGSKFTDWDAAFRKWLRNASKFDQRGGRQPVRESRPDPKTGVRVERSY